MSLCSAALVETAASPTPTMFLQDVLGGLQGHPRAIPCKWLYDSRGSELFEQICLTEDYYVTRTELGLLRRYREQLAEHLGGGVEILEPGAGSGEKVCLLLAKMNRPAAYLPLDISPSATEAAVSRVRHEFPSLLVEPRIGDFTRLGLQAVPRARGSKRRVLFFPGSTLGNFSPTERAGLLGAFRRWLQPGDMLLLGVDLQKDVAVLERAYDDRQGVTAEFNLNLLTRLRDELGARVDPSRFRHRAIFNSEQRRIEMHLVSVEDQLVTVAGRPFRFRRGDFIHTENSHKFDAAELVREVAGYGFELVERVQDDEDYFSLQLFRARSCATGR